MSWLSKYLFNIAYYPIEHQSVKQGFLQWYFQATQNKFVVEGLQVDNSQLVELTLEAARAAERMDSKHPAIKLLDTFDEYITRMKVGLAYLAVLLFLLGAGTLAVSVYTIDDNLFRRIGISIGSIIGLPAVSLSIGYVVLEHQIRTNADLVAKFNRKLVERPGKVRQNDRHWNKLAAQYLWNRSLSRPKTIIVLVLLSVIKVARPSLYGTISGELQHQVRDFVNEDGKNIIKIEIKRALQGKFVPHNTSSENTYNTSNNNRRF